MEMATIDKVKELMSKQLGISVDDITPDKEIVKDLGADSLDIVEMLMTFEDEFGVTMPEEDTVDIKTVQDIVTLLEKNM